MTALQLDQATLTPINEWLSRVTAVVRSEVLLHWKPDSCIASTRVLVDTLAYFGIDATPTPTRAAVFNRLAWGLAQQNKRPSAWPPEAWSVGVEGEGPAVDGGWNGHLVAVVRKLLPYRVLIDPSGDQFARPQHAIFATPLVASLPALWTPQDPLVAAGVDLDDQPGPVYVYAPLTGSHGWRLALDWCGNVEPVTQAVAGSVSRIIEEMGERAPLA